MRKLILFSAVIALGILLWVAFDQITTDTTLTAAEIESRVATLYEGTVTSNIKKGERYYVTFNKNDATYEVMVNEVDGGFSNLQLIASGTTPLAPPPTQQAPSNVTLSESQASAIALTQFDGKIDEMDFIHTADGGYYLIEIEAQETDIIVQIHAITGKVLSVTFDD